MQSRCAWGHFVTRRVSRARVPVASVEGWGRWEGREGEEARNGNHSPPFLRYF